MTGAPTETDQPPAPTDASGAPGAPGGGEAPSRAKGPLFDLNPISLAATMISAESIGGYIPHTGHMRQIDRVIWHSADFTRALAIKRVLPDEFWCAGHIPGKPILPGVLMIESGAQLASIMYFARMNHRRFAGFTRIEDTVFRGMVVPGDDLYLLALEVKFNPRRFVSDVQGIVNGRIVFESRITGMILEAEA